MGQNQHKEPLHHIDSGDETFSSKHYNSSKNHHNNNNNGTLNRSSNSAGGTLNRSSSSAGEGRSKISTLLRKRPSFNKKKKGEDPIMSDQQQYRYMTVEKIGGDDSLRIDVTQDERDHSRDSFAGGVNEYIISNHNVSQSQHSPNNMSVISSTSDNVDIARTPVNVGFLVSFLVDARGGAMKGCRHSGVRVIVPPRKAAQPMRVTCRYLRKDKILHPPVIMESEALASRVLELGPAGAKFLGPVIIEVPHFASLRDKERELIILRSDDGTTWKEHKLDASEEAVQEVLNESFPGEELRPFEDLHTSRIVRILTVDFPQYFAIVSRIRQEIHAVGPEGGVVSSSAVPLVQALFPPDALTKRIKVGLQAQPIPPEIVSKLLGNRVAVSPIVTIEPRRRKFHKPITLTIPLPQAANKGMINQYSGNAPTLRLLCSITGGNSKAVWEDVTGATPLTFVKDCVSFTTTISARFWLVDCSNINQAPTMASDLYNLASHVPFMAKFVVFAKRTDLLEARLRIFCMTDDREDKTLEHQEHFTEVAKSRDIEVLQGKPIHVEFGGNLIPIAKSGEQLCIEFRAFKENRLPFTVRVRDPDEPTLSRILFMKDPKVARGDVQQQPICTLNISLPDNIVPESAMSESDLLNLEKTHQLLRDNMFANTETIQRADIRLSDISNLLAEDWTKLAKELNVSQDDINAIQQEYEDNPYQQALVMLKLWMKTQGGSATGNTLETALRNINRDDIVNECIYNVEIVTDDMERAVAKVRLDQSGFETLKEELGPSRESTLTRKSSKTSVHNSNSNGVEIIEITHQNIIDPAEDEMFLKETSNLKITEDIKVEVPTTEDIKEVVPPTEDIKVIEPPTPTENKVQPPKKLSKKQQAAEKKRQQEQAAAEKKLQQEQAAAEKKLQQEQAAAEKQLQQEKAAAEKKQQQQQQAAEKKQQSVEKKQQSNKQQVAVDEPIIEKKEAKRVANFLENEITNSSNQLVPELSTSPGQNSGSGDDSTGWEIYHPHQKGNGKDWESENDEDIVNNGGGNIKITKTTTITTTTRTNGNNENQELWRSPSLEAEMIIKDDIPHETRWSTKRSDSQEDSSSDYDKDMKRSNSGNNNQPKKLIPSSSGSDIAMREGSDDSEDERTNNGADLTHENSTQNFTEIVNNKRNH